MSLARGGGLFRVPVALSSRMLDNCSEATTVSVCVENDSRQRVVQIFMTVSTLLSMRDGVWSEFNELLVVLTVFSCWTKVGFAVLALFV